MEASERAQDLSDVEQITLIDDLQSKLTKTQLLCLEERRNFLNLVGENEQLKLENEDLKRNFQAALLLGKVEERAVTHFLHNNPKAPELTDKIIKLNVDLQTFDGEKRPKYPVKNPTVLAKQVDFLQNHIEEIKQQHFVEVFALKTSIEASTSQWILTKAQYEARLKEVATRLEDTRALLHNANEECLKLKKKLLTSEDNWAKEQKKLIQQLGDPASSCSILACGSSSDMLKHVNAKNDKPTLEKQLLEKLTRAEVQLIERQTRLKEYELKFLRLERIAKRATELEKETKRTCSDVIRKLRHKNETMESRFERLDERRKFDNAGFRQDIKHVKMFLAAIEKKIYIFMHRKEKQLRELDGTEDFSKTSLTEDNMNTKTNIPQQPQPERVRPQGFGSLPRASSAKILNNGVAQTHIALPKDALRPSNQKLVEKAKPRPRKEERIESRAEIEKDKLIYEMLCQVLDSAKTHVGKIEKGILENEI